MNTQDMALLLGEGEAAKAQELHTYLNSTRALRSADDANVILWRTYFAHLAAATHYAKVARANKPKGDLTPINQIIDECDLVKVVLKGYVESIARNDALRAIAKITNHLKSFT